MPERHSTKELFYGYPDWVIAEWCCVSLQTARHWKSGIRAPGPAATKLFMLHRDGRILTSEWEGWGIHQGKLCDPEGHETSQGQLRAYPFVWQLANEFARFEESAAQALSRLSLLADGDRPRRSALRQPPARKTPKADSEAA